MSDTVTRRRIRAQGSARDPDVVGFVLDAPVQPGRAARFDGPGNAPLARALFALPGVHRVEVRDATIWVQKDTSGDWGTLKPAIAETVRRVLDATEMPLGAGDAPDPDTQLLTEVSDLLDRQINPSVAAHGGHIAVERVSDRKVYLRMSGGCQGCAASSATLRQGVEQMLRAALPQIAEIVDVTDHGAGTTPFYERPEGRSPMLSRPIPEGVIGWEAGRVTVDPDYLAPRLGLTADSLREGLRTGEVVGVTETGLGPDKGKTRIVMRSPMRAWAAEIEPSGRAHEVPPPRSGPDSRDMPSELYSRIRAHLETLEGDATLTYGALARAMGLYMPGAVQKVARALEDTMREDAAAGRPFIAARVVGRGRAGLPAPAFFDLARNLSRGPEEGESDMAFYDRELARLNTDTEPLT